MLFYWFDIFGVMVFAITGALAAGTKQMDVFGALVLALVTALGGGTLRDLVLGIDPVFWIADLTYVYVVAATAFITVAVARRYRLPQRLLSWADAFGLSIFCVLGTQVALEHGTPVLVAIIMGMLTGVAGGMIRDVLRSEIPFILKDQIYATAALLGGSCFAVLQTVIPSPRALAIAAALTLVVRLAAIRWNMQLPTVRTREHQIED